MDGETEGYLGGIFGEVSPSVPLMPIAVLSSVPSQIAVGAGPTSKLAKAGRPRGAWSLRAWRVRRRRVHDRDEQAHPGAPPEGYAR
jgi:hypothetical protein